MRGDDIMVNQQPVQVPEGTVHAVATTATSSSNWLPYGRYLKINERLFEDAGLVVVQYVPSHEKKSLSEQSPKDGFILGGRTLLLSKFTYKIGQKPSKAYTLHLKLVGDSSEPTLGTNFSIISTKEHRKEVFFPLVVQNREGHHIGFYIYPRISGTAADTYRDLKTIRFNRFVTAVCMLGSSLVGIDQRDNELSLIKHGLDTVLFIDQCITAVEYREGICPYEEALFMEFGHVLSMASHLAADSGEKTFLVHLPGFDYLLFAADLVTAGQMTLGAFEQLSHIIIERSAVYKKKLNEIFQESPLSRSTTLLMQSPFENIFGSYNEYFEDAGSVYDRILACLDVELSKSDDIKDNQRNLVEYCLEKLISNAKNSDHQVVWQDILSTRDPAKRPSTMEDLLRLANAMMLANGSRGQAQDKTCSILPITEKQIQVAYDEELDIPGMNARHPAEKDVHYSSFFHITHVDSMTTYRSPSDALELSCTGTKDATKRGLPFYFNRYGGASDIRTLIREKDVLGVAHRNVGNTGEALSLESVLNSNLAAANHLRFTPESRPSKPLIFSGSNTSSLMSGGSQTPENSPSTSSGASNFGVCEEQFLGPSHSAIKRSKSLSDMAFAAVSGFSPKTLVSTPACLRRTIKPN